MHLPRGSLCQERGSPLLTSCLSANRHQASVKQTVCAHWSCPQRGRGPLDLHYACGLAVPIPQYNGPDLVFFFVFFLCANAHTVCLGVVCSHARTQKDESTQEQSAEQMTWKRQRTGRTQWKHCLQAVLSSAWINIHQSRRLLYWSIMRLPNTNPNPSLNKKKS